MHEEGIGEAAVVGRIVGPGTGRVFVRSLGRRQMPCPRRQLDPAPATVAPVTVTAGGQTAQCCTTEETDEMTSGEMSCCAGGHDAASGAAASVASETRESFQNFLKSANAPGALDARTKKAMAIALSLLAKCEPCAKIHIKKATDMGFSQEEIDEAAWMAVAFGGAPTMMFYNEVKRALAGR